MSTKERGIEFQECYVVSFRVFSVMKQVSGSQTDALFLLQTWNHVEKVEVFCSWKYIISKFNKFRANFQSH